MIKYLPVLFFFILADVVGENCVLRVFGSQPPVTALLLSVGMLVVQMIAAPIQAGFSDFYCRKKSLIASLIFSLASIILLLFTKSTDQVYPLLFILILILSGALGNTIPLAWAALADSREKNIRLPLALSSAAYAIAYLVLAFSSMGKMKAIFDPHWLSPDRVSVFLFIVSILLCMFFFADRRDRKSHFEFKDTKLKYLRLAHAESTSLIKEVSCKRTRLGLLAYLLWATSQYSVLILLTDFQVGYKTTVIWMMCGYLVGVAILGFLKDISDEKMIRAGFIVTIAAIPLFYIWKLFKFDSKTALTVCFFVYTVGNAFLSPSILSLFSKERKLNQQGKGFGLIISADTLGFLIALILVILYKDSELNLKYLTVFSFVVFMISWFPYVRYEKIRKNSLRIDTAL